MIVHILKNYQNIEMFINQNISQNIFKFAIEI